jgi:pilus assembly protein FimV
MSIALGLALIPISVFAAGLGQLNVASGIGEPLKAEIELLSVTDSEKASLKASIAPEETYATQGLDRPASHKDINVQITKDANGKDILKLISNQPITEPFLDMLVEVEWETGRILREYTVLLDPPGYRNQLSAAQIQAPTIKSVNNISSKPVAPIKQTQPLENTASRNTASKPSVTDTQNDLTEDYLTRKGDTLSKIARRLKPEGVSLDQMLIGLYESNPEAFAGNNMNRLKVGKILQPPTEEALNAISRKEAAKEIKVQTANWNEYRNKLAGIVADSTPLASEEDAQSSSGKIKPATEDQSIPENTGPKDVVKLSSSDAKNAADMEAKITALQEEVSAREKGLKEAQERTTALEKQIEDMQKLLTLKNDALSGAQQSVEEVPTESVEAETEAVQPPPVRLGTKLQDDGAVAETSKQAENTVNAETKPARTSAETPVEQPSFISSLLASFSNMFSDLDTTLLGAGAALLALLSGGWFYLRNKRRKNLADFEQGIMTSGGLKANTVFGNTSGASVDTGDTSFLTDFSQSTSGGMIDTNDVDPIAEAEVYMAYGRDAQAEEILKDAITKEPKRYELHLKLLEMYAASKDMSAFETVSGELYTTLGAEDPTWAKVAEIGIKLEPNNPLYQTKAGVGVSAKAAVVTDPIMNEKLDASDFSDSPLANEADLDFSLNDELDSTSNESEFVRDEPEGVEEEAESDGIDFNVEESTLDIPNVSEKLEMEESALDFDLNFSTEQKNKDSLSDAALGEANFAHTMPNLDFPKLEGEEESASDSLPNEKTVETDEPSVEMPKIEMPNDLTLDMPSADEESESIVIDEVSEDETNTENFGFDVNTLTEDTVTLEEDKQEEATTVEQAKVFDLSDISLEVNEDVNQAIVDAEPELEVEEAFSAPESEEVETKLELVAAYIDMEDKEGAKELLDEVIKEGGANQRKRAEEILATLG